MTDKRFINDVDNGKLYDTKGEMCTIHYDDRVDFYSLWGFLNKLNDENELLSDMCDEYLSSKDFLENENEWLKKENNKLRQSFDKSLLSHTKTCDDYRALSKKNKRLKEENEQLKAEKEFWKGDACNCSNYLSILSMDCQIVQEAICDLKNVIDVDTEAFKLLDELDDKFDELNQHRIKMYSR